MREATREAMGMSDADLARMIENETPMLAAQMADLLGETPETWRESVAAMVWECYHVEPTKQRHKALLHFDTSWHWGEITPATEFAACLQRSTPQGAFPDAEVHADSGFV